MRENTLRHIRDCTETLSMVDVNASDLVAMLELLTVKHMLSMDGYQATRLPGNSSVTGFHSLSLAST